MNTDGFGKSPDAALRFLPRRCGIRKSTPHSSDRERNPEAPRVERRGARNDGSSTLPGLAARRAVSQLARLACGLFYEAVTVFDAVMARCMNVTYGCAKSSVAALRFIPVLALVLFAPGCAGLPPLKPLDAALKPAVLKECRVPFLPVKYRLVHALSILLPDGGTTTAIGVLVADPQNESFRSVLMTLEGLVLFDGENGAIPSVHRAVPPFDSPAFARRMAEDIGLAFFAPGGEPVVWGQEEKGFRGCRFARPGGGFVDVLKGDRGVREIRLYGTGQELLKRVKIPFLQRPGLADELEIRGEGWPSYGLRLQLIESEKIED
jgi:hypothetical protein